MSEGFIRRRHVFFLSGFDPKGASYYHGLYRREATLQSTVTGAAYDVGPRTRGKDGNSTWHVRSSSSGVQVDTAFEYVRWDDIVRAHWPRNAWQVLVGSMRGYWAALASPSALKKVWHASPRTLVALAYPAIYWLLAFMSGVACAAALIWLLGIAAGSHLPLDTVRAVAILAGVGIWWGALVWERRLNTSWLLRIYQFAGDWRQGRTPSLQPRLDRLANDILRRLADPEIDEVLLVGFSVGSLLAASATARVQQRTSCDVSIGCSPGRVWETGVTTLQNSQRKSTR